jgi:hypothetical protein
MELDSIIALTVGDLVEHIVACRAKVPQVEATPDA